MNRRIFISIVLTGLMLSLGFYLHSIHKYERGFGYEMLFLFDGLLVFISSCFILGWLFFLFLKGQYFNYKGYMSILILTAGILLLFSPLFKEEESVPVIFEACYEGTQNTSRAFFRADNRLEIHATAIFGYDEWFLGTWRKKGDTLFINYKTEKHRLMADTNVIKNNTIWNVFQNSLKKQNGFYIGKCKGKN